MTTKTKISAIILTKDELPDSLKDCINHIQPYVSEVVVIDSSKTDTSAEIVSNKLNTQYYHKEINNKEIKGFNDLRNFGQSISTYNWCLHVDVDELFSTQLFNEIDNIINNKDTYANAYAFPRINLPFYELYPDYQVRLVNRMNTEWIDQIHEKIDIFTDPTEVKYLDTYPIIHKPKTYQDKIEINKKWKYFNKNRNILICSLFKDSEKYLTVFLQHLSTLINYSTKHNHKIELCFIEGNSTDNTFNILSDWKNKSHDIKIKLHKLNLPDMERFQKLAILRNMLIKFGLKSYHDYVLMIDSDTLFHQDLLIKLINSIELNNCDVIAPLPLIENFRDYKNDYFYDTLAFIDNNNNNFRHFYPYCDEISKKDIIRMTSVGTCYLIRANIYNINDFNNYNILKCYDESIIKQPIEYEGYDNNNKPISEQVSFFNKVKRKGFQIYVDNNIEIFHINLEKLGLNWH